MYFIIDANDVVLGASRVCIIKQMNLKVYSVIVNNLILMKPYNCWKLYKETRNHSLNVIYEVIFMVVAQLKSMVSFLDAYWDTNTVSFCSFSAQNTKMCIFFYCLQIVERNKNSQPRVFSDVVFCYLIYLHVLNGIHEN